MLIIIGVVVYLFIGLLCMADTVQDCGSGLDAKLTAVLFWPVMGVLAIVGVARAIYLARTSSRTKNELKQ